MFQVLFIILVVVFSLLTLDFILSRFVDLFCLTSSLKHQVKNKLDKIIINNSFFMKVVILI